MIGIEINVRTQELDRFRRQLIGVVGRIRHDVRRLGGAGYKYMKTYIPVSNLSRPHLRDSFKITTKMIPGPGIHLRIFTDLARFPYAPFIDMGADIPTRYARSRKAMVFEVGGQKVFARSAKGFRLKGTGFVDKTEAWLALNVFRYVDPTLKRYLK